MEQSFQTSFIPKKPIIEKKAVPTRPASLFLVAAIFILIAIALASGGLYFYKSILVKNIEQKKNNLELAKNRFEPAKIAQLQTLDKRLRSADQVLEGHISISPIFKALQDITMKTVRYTKFSYEIGSDKDPSVKNIKVKMSGQAIGYRSVALQSDLFKKNKNLLDPVFSNLSLDDKGHVLFDLEFSVEPNFVDYQQNLQVQEGEFSN